MQLQDIKQVVLTTEFISSVAGVLVGAGITFYLDFKKDLNMRKDNKKIILTDIEMQKDILVEFEDEFNKLKNHLLSNDYESDTYNSNVFAHSDNVYKSHTMLQYHSTFGSEIFIQFQNVYERLIVYKTEPPEKVWLNLHNRHVEILHSNNIENRVKPNELIRNRDAFLRVVETNVATKNILMDGLTDLQIDIDKKRIWI